MDTPALTHISLCAGYGGLDLGLRAALPSLRTIAYSEIEACSAEVLLARMAQGQLEPAPLWTDLKSFPWEQYRRKVSIISGGYPCQPFALVGRRLGANDPRHLWPFILDGIRRAQPIACFFENVEGHITLGLEQVIADLGAAGYRATWGLFSAAEAGAPHARNRVFILAVLDDAQRTGLEGHLRSDGDAAGRQDADRPVAAPAFCNGWRAVQCDEPEQSGDAGATESLVVGGVEYRRPVTNWPQYPAHGIKPGEPARLLSPSESRVGGDPYGAPDRVDRLRMLGNGVCPAQAANAFRTLARRLADLT